MYKNQYISPFYHSCSPLMWHANCISFAIIVTCFACIVHTISVFNQTNQVHLTCLLQAPYCIHHESEAEIDLTCNFTY